MHPYGQRVLNRLDAPHASFLLVETPNCRQGGFKAQFGRYVDLDLVRLRPGDQWVGRETPNAFTVAHATVNHQSEGPRSNWAQTRETFLHLMNSLGAA